MNFDVPVVTGVAGENIRVEVRNGLAIMTGFIWNGVVVVTLSGVKYRDEDCTEEAGLTVAGKWTGLPTVEAMVKGTVLTRDDEKNGLMVEKGGVF